MKNGAVVKTIRKNKNIKIKNICENIIDQGNYWRFENNKIDISSTIFLEILSRLNISLEEFAFIKSLGNTEDYTTLGKQMISQFNTQNVVGLTTIHNQALALYQTGQGLRFLHLSFLCQLYCNRLKHSSYNEQAVISLKNYLEKCENWNYYEIALLNNCLFIFNYDDCLFFFYKFFLKFHSNLYRPSSINEEISFAQNMLTMCLERKDEKNTRKIIKMINSVKPQIISMESRTIILWLNGIVDCLLNQDVEGIDLIYKALSIFEFLQMTNLHQLHISWTNSLFAIYDKEPLCRN